MIKIGIIGGGAGGVCASLALAAHGFHITLLEASDSILKHTSARTPGRLGLGFHYPGDESLKSAETVIHAAIEFKRAFPDAILETSDNTAFLNQGWYFITKNSQQSPKSFLKYCDDIQKFYRQQSDLYGENYYGKPEELFRILEPDEFKNVVSLDKVSLGIQTKENLLDWYKMSLILSQELIKFSNIEVCTRHRVIQMKKRKQEFIVTSFMDNQINKEQAFDILINATCEYRLLLDAMLGFQSKQLWVNRLKLLASLDLPPELRSRHSIFFARGPFAMFTNSGNSRGFATFAPVTNHGWIDASKPLPLEWEKMIYEGLSTEMQEQISQRMIEGVAKYIPGIEKAKVREVIAGVVQHMGNADIYSAHSDLHKRYNTGIYQYESHYFSLDTGKLCFAPYYAKILADIILRDAKKL
jgi:hypothetical protein